MRLILITMVFLCFGKSIEAAEIGGNLKWFGTLAIPKNIDTPSGPIQGNTTFGTSGRFRLQIAEDLSNQVRAEAAYEWVPSWIEGGGSLAGTNAFSATSSIPYRLVDLSRQLASGSNARLIHNLDRLNAVFYFPFADFTVGRQAVSAGVARVISPLDVLTPFNFDSLDTEFRTGVDGITGRIPLGSLSQVSFGVVFGRDLEASSSAAYLSARHHLYVVDVLGSIVSYQGSTMGGIGMEGSLFGAGVWWELAHTWVRRLSGTDKSNYLRTSVGLDYSPWEGVYLFTEYHYNGAGGAPATYLSQLGDFAYQKGGVFLLARHYLSIGTTIAASGLTSLGGTYIQNLSDGSFILSGTIQYNFAQDWYLDAGTYFGFGAGPLGSQSNLTLRSEFGSGGGFFFTSLRYYY